MCKDEKKLLIITDSFWPNITYGGPVRSLRNLVENLSEDINIRIITSDRAKNMQDPYKEVESNRWIALDGASVMYLSPDRQTWGVFKELINTIEHDCLMINGVFNFPFSIYPILLNRLGAIQTKQVIILPRGQFSKGALELKQQKKATFLWLFKVLSLDKNMIWQATGNHEEKDIIRILKNRKIVVLPNFAGDYSSAIKQSTKKKGELRMVFLSRISRMKNLDYALKRLMETKKAGNITFDIYGFLEDNSYFNECESLIQSMPDHVKVEYHGPVDPSDVQKVIGNYDLLFLPTCGENYGNVIIEALSTGTPVLISDRTPWSDISENGAGYAIPLESPTNFVDTINFLLKADSTIFQNLRYCARAYSNRVREKNQDLRKKYLRIYFGNRI